MINLAPTAIDALAKSATYLTDGLSKNIPVVGNVAICTTGRAGMNLYLCPNPITKVFFGASCVFGTVGACSIFSYSASNFICWHIDGRMGWGVWCHKLQSFG